MGGVKKTAAKAQKQSARWGAPFSFAAMTFATEQPQPFCSGRAGKGVLFSFAAMLLCVCIMMFASIAADWSLQSRQMASRLVDMDRATDTYSNAEDGLVEISSLATDITVDNKMVIISSPLPAPEVSVYLQRFAQFESNLSDLTFSAGTSSLASRSFLIQPSNISISHQNQALIALPLSPLAQGGLPDSYDVELIFSTATVDAASWSPIHSDSGASGIPVHVRVRDTRYAVLLDFSEKINRSAESILNITSSGVTVATVRFNSPSALEVTSAQDIDLKTSIGLSIPAFVETADVLSVVSTANKTGRLRVGG